LNSASESPPVVAFYCATFLKPEMLHIYRQITALERVRAIVIAQKRENAGIFPFDPVHIVPKPATHFLRRFWYRQLRDIPWQLSAREVAALLRLLTTGRAQLLQIFFGHIAVHLIPLIRAWPNPTIVSFHGADVLVDMDKPAYRRATQEMLTLVRRVLVRSESLRRAIVDLGCDENKIDVVRTGIPLDQFPFRQRSFPSRDREGEWRLLQACRLVEKKGLATTLHAFTGFLVQYPKATITIAGEGPLLEDLRSLAAKLRIENRVNLPGFISQEELRRIFYASHIFLHPSETGRDGNQEGIPNSMLEAMASGLPVFATNHGGIPEAIENGVSGILVPERDYQALGRALLDSAQNPSLLSQMARAGSEAVRQKFDQKQQARTLEELYLETMSATSQSFA
jgi:colanic acid/amylovoran biosynthesis glycosyltransferase